MQVARAVLGEGQSIGRSDAQGRRLRHRQEHIGVAQGRGVAQGQCAARFRQEDIRQVRELREVHRGEGRPRALGDKHHTLDDGVGRFKVHRSAHRVGPLEVAPGLGAEDRGLNFALGAGEAQVQGLIFQHQLPSAAIGRPLGHIPGPTEGRHLGAVREENEVNSTVIRVGPGHRAIERQGGYGGRGGGNRLGEDGRASQPQGGDVESIECQVEGRRHEERAFACDGGEGQGVFEDMGGADGRSEVEGRPSSHLHRAGETGPVARALVGEGVTARRHPTVGLEQRTAGRERALVDGLPNLALVRGGAGVGGGGVPGLQVIRGRNIPLVEELVGDGGRGEVVATEDHLAPGIDHEVGARILPLTVRGILIVVEPAELRGRVAIKEISDSAIAEGGAIAHPKDNAVEHAAIEVDNRGAFRPGKTLARERESHLAQAQPSAGCPVPGDPVPGILGVSSVVEALVDLELEVARLEGDGAGERHRAILDGERLIKGRRLKVERARASLNQLTGLFGNNAAGERAGGIGVIRIAAGDLEPATAALKEVGGSGQLLGCHLDGAASAGDEDAGAGEGGLREVKRAGDGNRAIVDEGARGHPRRSQGDARAGLDRDGHITKGPRQREAGGLCRDND